MQIQVVSVSKPEWKEKGPKSKWQELTLTFTTAGKTQVKKFMSFSPIFSKIKEMEAGEEYDVQMTKNDAGYWDWIEVAKLVGGGGAGQGEAPKATVARPSTYETAEERAIKQKYIVRQSSIGYAIEYSKDIKAIKSVEEILALAKRFEEYVFAPDDLVQADPFDDMEDDIPA